MHVGAKVEQHTHRVDLVGAGGAGERGALVIGAAGVYLSAGFEQEAGALSTVGAMAGPVDDTHQQGAVALIAGGGEAGVLGQQGAEGIEVALVNRRDGGFVHRMEIRLGRHSPSGKLTLTGRSLQEKPGE